MNATRKAPRGASFSFSAIFDLVLLAVGFMHLVLLKLLLTRLDGAKVVINLLFKRPIVKIHN
jgi:hypothetical protein